MVQFHMAHWKGVMIGQGITAREVKLFTSPHSTIQSEDFSTGITVIPPGKEHEIHRHEANLELQVIYNGTGILYSGGKEYSVCKGDIIGLGLNEEHGFRNTGKENLEILWIYYPSGAAEEKFLIAHDNKEYISYS